MPQQPRIPGTAAAALPPRRPLPTGMPLDIVAEALSGARDRCELDGIKEGPLSRHFAPHLPSDHLPPRKRPPTSSVTSGGAAAGGAEHHGVCVASAHSDGESDMRSESSWRRKGAAPARSPLE